jgi:putative sigma-54 modulation protein
MEVTIRPKNFKLQPNIEAQVRKRVDRLTHHLENLDSCEVLLTQEPTRFNAQRVQNVVQLTLRTRTNNLIRSEVTDADLLTAVDQAMDRVTRQIERFKGRFYQKKKGKQGIGKSSAEIVAMHPTSVEEEEPAVPVGPAKLNGDTDDDTLGDIVRVKRFSVEPMYPEEAVEQMELLGHTFFVFYNAGEERFNVLYRRSDGNYGLLQPELS